MFNKKICKVHQKAGLAITEHDAQNSISRFSAKTLRPSLRELQARRITLSLIMEIREKSELGTLYYTFPQTITWNLQIPEKNLRFSTIVEHEQSVKAVGKPPYQLPKPITLTRFPL